MKKYLTLIFLLFLFVFTLSSCGGNGAAKFTYDRVDGGYAITCVNTNGNKDIVFPATYKGEAVVRIGDNIGQSLGELNAVVVSEGIREIGDKFLSGDKPIKQLTLPGTLTKIGTEFLGNMLVEEIIMSEGDGAYVTKDGIMYSSDYATLVRYPSGKKDVFFIVPSGVEKIGKYAFMGSSYVQSVSLSTDTREIEDHAFENSKIKVLNTEGVKVFGNAVFSGCSFNSLSINSYEIVGEMFTDCDVKNLNLGSYVENIDKSAFSHLYNLSEINVSDSNEKYRSFNGHLTTTDKKTLLLYVAGQNPNIYNIPYGIEVIDEYACSERYRATRITIPETVRVIKANAFRDCANLKDVYIGINVMKIEAYAFYGCVSLSSATFAYPDYWHLGGTPYNVGNPANNAIMLMQLNRVLSQHKD